jgi:hypothetical protein
MSTIYGSVLSRLTIRVFHCERVCEALQEVLPLVCQGLIVVTRCSIPDVCIDERRLPLFIARATLGELIAGLEARATGGAAP